MAQTTESVWETAKLIGNQITGIIQEYLPENITAYLSEIRETFGEQSNAMANSTMVESLIVLATTVVGIVATSLSYLQLTP